MTVSESQKLVLSGLPGAGVSRLLKGIVDEFPENFICEKVSFQQQREVAAPLVEPFFWVMDIRQDLTALQSQFAWWLEELKTGLQVADAVILNFVEEADLTQQTQWQAFLRDNFPELPVFRSFYHAMPQGLVEFAQNLDPSPKSTGRLNLDALKNQPDWQCFEFELPRVSLDALIMALANSQQSMQIKIARIQGNLQTMEYENRVALEVSGPLWKTFAAESEVPEDQLIIQGIDLDKSWFLELIQASKF